MMKTRTALSAFGGLTALAVTLLVSAPASGAVKPEDQFQLQGTHGYEILGFGDKGVGSLTAKKGMAASSYGKSGVTTARRLKVDLGKFGEIDVRFHAKKTRKVPPPKGCTGRKSKQEVGTWTGKIRFRGEKGYSEVRAKEARGKVTFRRKADCSGDIGPLTQLSAEDGSGSTRFLATKRGPNSKAKFVAVSLESEGKINIFRDAFPSGPSNTFTFDDMLTTAHVAPPPPFSGTADFASPDSWMGNLRVNFPGRKHVALTGTGWTAHLAAFN